MRHMRIQRAGRPHSQGERPRSRVWAAALCLLALGAGAAVAQEAAEAEDAFDPFRGCGGTPPALPLELLQRRALTVAQFLRSARAAFMKARFPSRS